MLGLVRVQPSMIFRVPISEKEKEKDKTKEKERNVKDKRERGYGKERHFVKDPFLQVILFLQTLFWI